MEKTDIGKMNIQVKFFAQLREQLECEQLSMSLDVSEQEVTVGQVMSELSLKGDVWLKNLDKSRVLMALNHEIVDSSAIVKAGDEVAFFPPVTGG